MMEIKMKILKKITLTQIVIILQIKYIIIKKKFLKMYILNNGNDNNVEKQGEYHLHLRTIDTIYHVLLISKT